MRRKKVWRYYCDFCNRGGCSGTHMKRHEAHCCKNPNRVCGMCAQAGLGQHKLPELIAALGRGKEEGVAALRKAAEGCPACMLAAIIQSGLQRKPDVDDPGFSVTFTFKTEKDAFWKEVNSARAEHF